jgi:hypothetical protein
MGKDCYYFSHDSNAKDDPKCSMLIEQMGLNGYGIYWVLVETLRDQPNYRYPLVLIPVLARKYNTTLEQIKQVITGYGLFEVDADSQFFSWSLNRRMEKFEQIREINRQKGIKSGEARKQLPQGKGTVVEPQLNSGSTIAEQVKESKEKESKENIICEVMRDPKRTNINDYHDMYMKRYNFKPHITTKLTVILDKLSKEFGREEVCNRLLMYFKDDADVVVKSRHSAELFASQFNRYVYVEDRNDPNGEYQRKLREAMQKERDQQEEAIRCSTQTTNM